MIKDTQVVSRCPECRKVFFFPESVTREDVEGSQFDCAHCGEALVEQHGMAVSLKRIVSGEVHPDPEDISLYAVEV